MKGKRALIFGANGQAGFYLSEYLHQIGYTVFGTYHHKKDKAIATHATLYKVDITDKQDVEAIIQAFTPDEIYNLASLMYAPASWKKPHEYIDVNFCSLTSMLESILLYASKAKFFYSGSAEVFDLTHATQSIHTRHKPRNPYGVAKMAAQHLVRVYRELGMYACTGVLFNMESPLRETTFFANKVCRGAALISAGKQDVLRLERLSAIRDWGWTEEYVRIMHLMLQQTIPQDLVIGTGEAHSCLEFVHEALDTAGVSRDKLVYDKTGASVMDSLHADPIDTTKALKWRASVRFREVIKRLVEHYSHEAGKNQ